MKLAQKLAVPVLVAISFVPILQFAYLGLQSRPMSDDYCHISTAARMNVLDYIVHWRHFVDGSYSGYAVHSFLSPFGFEVARFFPAILIGFWFASTATLVAKCMRLLAIERHRLVVAVWLSALLVAAISSALYSKMALYWYAASVKYSVPMVTLTWYLLLLLYAACRARVRIRSALLTIAGGALCFATAGFAETFSIVLLVGLLFLFGALIAVRGQARQRCLAIVGAGWLATVASMLVTVTAPGVALRVERELARSPNPLHRTSGELLTQTWQTWTDRVSDPAVFAGFVLLLAAGLLASLIVAKPSKATGSAPRQLARNPLLFGLMVQLLLLPLIWLHQSTDSSVLGRFSAAYAVVIVCNTALIAGLALMLLQRERASAFLRGRERIVTGVALAFILLLFALTQLRSIHWRAYAYLWVSFHSLLLVLAWLLSWRLPKAALRGFAIGIGSLYATTWAATAVVAATGQYIAGRDIERTFTFAAHLGVWQGLAWGVFLGYAIGAVKAATGGSTPLWFKFSLLVVVLALGGGIVADQLALVPKFQQYASNFDARHAEITAQIEEGKRRISIVPLSFDLEPYLKVARLHSNRCPLQYYEVDAIVIETP